MKCLAVLSFLILSDALLASPIISRNVDPFAELTKNVNVNDSKHRWSLVPDSEGRMHMVDLNPLDLDTFEPLSIPEEDVVFILHTRTNPTVGQVITNNLASIQNSNFNPDNPTRVTIHGWLGTAGSEVNVGVNSAYFQRGDYNMITVDWSIGASPVNYITARNRVGDTARWVAELIDFLHLNNYVRFEDLHAIGHSLGGQMVGLIGKAVTRGRIQVIYPLDPAGPLFSLDSPTERVHPTDGVYVEVMHTNGGLLGFREPIGQADFFPNYGRTQPGCGGDVSGQCAHARTVLFYAESINHPFTSHECSSFADIDNGFCTRTGRTALMGGAVGNIGLTGNFVVYTNEAAPFSMG